MRTLLIGVTALVVCQMGTVAADEPRVRFNRDIRPILSNNCFKCHGPDANHRKGGLRLDDPEKALLPAESGAPAIVPGKAEASELVRRILSADPAEAMPPPDSNKRLTATQKELLKRWVAEGAVYEAHWAFVPPQRPVRPAVKRTDWPRNEIDYFILERLEQEGLSPSPEADRATLFRRLSLDLQGLPPSAADTEAFTQEMLKAEPNGAAAVEQTYARWVDKILDSPHYGERMAVDWLDAARFADTNGYQVDRDREMYAWRDWVIEAFNTNQPFDQFTIEQLAGDLLPNATIAQKIATGFHRNHMLNEEGGVIPDEFLAEYCADRVETTATLWLGQTFNCTRCHDHKFDPFTQRDFYGLYAFFHNVTEQGIGNYGANIRRNAQPMLKLPSPELEARLAALGAEQAEVQRGLQEIDARLTSGQPEWEQRLRSATTAPYQWQVGDIVSATLDKNVLAPGTDKRVFVVPPLEVGSHALILEIRLPLRKATALLLDARPLSNQPASVQNPGDDKAALQLSQWRLVQAEEAPGGKPQPPALRAAEITGTLPVAEVAKALDAQGKSSVTLVAKSGTSSAVVQFDPVLTGNEPLSMKLGFTVLVAAKTIPWELKLSAIDIDADLLAPASVLSVVRKDAKERTPQEQKQLADFRAGQQADRRVATERIAGLARQIDETDLQIPTTLIMQEMGTPRATHILIRGEYNKLGDVVTANTPAMLPGMVAEWPKNRLGLARWLVDPANPLTARVTVNRLWQSLFGTGLVRTSEDFGTQGESPSHPDLLDWLATEFTRSGWNTKGMMRLLVTSATYRQSSRLTAALRERDAENRLLARGPRFRLQAEFLRDQALAASGLLVPKIGGPSVKPFHPPGLYEQVTAGNGTNTYVEGKGDELHRRSLYTYWKRSVPHPSMLVFDATFRETCGVRRPRTNTPLQALNLMNDPTYVEAARFLGERMLREGGTTLESQVTWGFRQVLVRPPRAAEAAILIRGYERAFESYRSDAAGTAELLRVGGSALAAGADPAQLAALTMVASAILNLDETVTKE